VDLLDIDERLQALEATHNQQNSQTLLPHVKIYSKADSLPQIKIYSKAVVSSYQQFGFYGQRLLPVTRPF
jgi:hypothetical protein